MDDIPTSHVLTIQSKVVNTQGFYVSVKNRLDFTSRATARVILGQLISIVTCGSQTYTEIRSKPANPTAPMSTTAQNRQFIHFSRDYLKEKKKSCLIPLVPNPVIFQSVNKLNLILLQFGKILNN